MSGVASGRPCPADAGRLPPATADSGRNALLFKEWLVFTSEVSLAYWNAVLISRHVRTFDRGER